MQNQIKSAVENTIKIAKVKGTVTVTPSFINIEEIATKSDAEKLEKAFLLAGMKSLGVDDMETLGMGNGFSLTISIK